VRGINRTALGVGTQWCASCGGGLLFCHVACRRRSHPSMSRRKGKNEGNCTRVLFLKAPILRYMVAGEKCFDFGLPPKAKRLVVGRVLFLSPSLSFLSPSRFHTSTHTCVSTHTTHTHTSTLSGILLPPSFLPSFIPSPSP
jgi:hypothetical protein